MNKVNYKPIGIVQSPFKDIEGTPIQPAWAEGIQASVGMFKEYCAGLKGLFASEPGLEPLLLLRSRL